MMHRENRVTAAFLRGGLSACATALCVAAHGGTYTWLASPANLIWDTSSATGTITFTQTCDLRGDFEVSANASRCGVLEVRGGNQSISGLRRLRRPDFRSSTGAVEQDTRYSRLRTATPARSPSRPTGRRAGMCNMTETVPTYDLLPG